MRQLLIIIFIGVISIEAFSQKTIVLDHDRLILKSKDGIITDTLDSNSFYTIKNDTLTRFLIGKSSSTDQCSSFSIIRELYKKENYGFGQFGTRTIRIISKCSSLWNEDPFCLRLGKFKVSNGTVHAVITDSDDKKLRVKLEGDKNFEIRLKNKVDTFISRSECNGVRIE